MDESGTTSGAPASAPGDRAGTLGLWGLLTLLPMVAIPVYLPVSALPTLDLGGLHANAWGLTGVLFLCTVGSTALALRGRRHRMAELQRSLLVGVAAAWLGFGMWTSYIHHISELSTSPDIPQVGEKAPGFSIALPEDFEVRLPMMPFPIKPNAVTLSAFAKKDRAVLLVFYRAHW